MSSSILANMASLPPSGVFTDNTPRAVAVSVRGLSKTYSIAKSVSKHTTAAEALMYRLRNPFQKIERETFSALDNVSFDIAKGDVVGILGRNGAGKSTLLKILSRITEPTKGQIDLYGRVGSLLEVGTGFSSELTGRENIYLNGAILGMSRSEIGRQFDAIVDFAGTEQFLDTPVKRYSSGMYVRLAFAVAAHLNPEILIVDEVLAVGDAEFQKKCLGKMRNVAQSGRTILFVSHALASIRGLCSKAILLHQGRLIYAGDVDQCIRVYEQDNDFQGDSVWEQRERCTESGFAIRRVAAKLDGDQPFHKLKVELEAASISAHKAGFINIDIVDIAGTSIMQPMPTVETFIKDTSPHHNICMTVDLPPLIPGRYSISVWIGSNHSETLDEVKECVGFEVSVSPTKDRVYPHYSTHGYIVPHTNLEYSTSA